MRLANESRLAMENMRRKALLQRIAWSLIKYFSVRETLTLKRLSPTSRPRNLPNQWSALFFEKHDEAKELG